MKRPIAYPGSEAYEWFISRPAQDAMVALGKFAAALIGTTGAVNGLSCSATTTPSMQVNMGMGELYQMAPVEATTCGTLPANTVDYVLKQGILLGANAPLALPIASTFTAPATPGQTINYLIEAQYQDQDVSQDPTSGASNVVLNFYNSANPSVPYSGPSNSGAASNTFRNGVIAFQIKAGTAATTGSQTTPAPDSGWIGLYSVSVAYGQTTILSTNIAAYPGAPFMSPVSLTGMGGSGGYAPIVSPTFLGSPSAPTPAQFNNTTLLATTAFVMESLGGVAGVQQLNTTSALSAAQANFLILCGGSGSTFILPPLSSVPVGTKQYLIAQSSTNSLIPSGTDLLKLAGASVASVAFGGSDSVEVTASSSGWQVTGGTALLAGSAAFKAGRFGYTQLAAVSVPASVGGVAGLVSQTLSFTPTINGILTIIASTAESSTAMGQNLVLNGTTVCADIQTPCVHTYALDVTAGTTYTILQKVLNGNTSTVYASLYLNYLFVPGV